MMTAGLNIRVDVYRFTYEPDDEVGGAQPTGSLYYQDLPAMLSSRRTSQLALEQGLETVAVFDLMWTAHWVDIRERDEVTVVWPTDHRHYGHWFRITGIQETPRRVKHGGGVFATAERIRRSRAHA